MYGILRGVYRRVDRTLLQRLPDGWMARAHALAFRLARRMFPRRISARSPAEFAASPAHRQAATSHLPMWARDEVQALVALEPMLGALVAEGATVEHYVIPWDMTYVGQRYAAARHRLSGPYACMLLSGGGLGADAAAQLAACPRPLAIIDIDDAPPTAQLAREVGADYVALPAGDLDTNDRCAVLARLVLQCAPRQLRHAAHPVLDACIQRHGLALASVTEVLPWKNGAAEPDGEMP